MNEYVYIENYTKRGDLAISYDVFDQIINLTLKHMNGVKLSKKANSPFSLNKPVRCQIKNGDLNADINVIISSSSNVNQVCQNIQEEVATAFTSMTEFVPLCVNVKVVGIE